MFEIADISPMLKAKPLSDGLHAVYTSPDGVQFSAEVKKGKIKSWVGTDARGRKLSTTVEMRRKNADRLPTPGEPGTIECWVCVTTTDGHIYCSKIPCKF
ncbi:MAG TPA: hypothetical protein VMR21_00965 [Vicinamibacteria bacterium]|nr:hypothetical protein [Vicinamibacteria bacterium]